MSGTNKSDVGGLTETLQMRGRYTFLYGWTSRPGSEAESGKIANSSYRQECKGSERFTESHDRRASSLALRGLWVIQEKQKVSVAESDLVSWE